MPPRPRAKEPLTIEELGLFDKFAALQHLLQKLVADEHKQADAKHAAAPALSADEALALAAQKIRASGVSSRRPEVL